MHASNALIVIRLVTALVVSSHAFHLAAAEDDEKINSIVRLLEAIPQWPTLPVSDTLANYEVRRQDAAASAKKIESIVAEISQHDLDSIRGAFVQFSKSTERRDALEIVNRYLFQIPKQQGFSDNERMAAYRWAVPLMKGGRSPEVNFPWELDDSGQLRFSIEARGFIGFGRPYDGLKAFDYYRAHFGRRVSPP